jgi:GT2 family glycosyltransferase
VVLAGITEYAGGGGVRRGCIPRLPQFRTCIAPHFLRQRKNRVKLIDLVRTALARYSGPVDASAANRANWSFALAIRGWQKILDNHVVQVGDFWSAMEPDLERQLLERLRAIEDRLGELEDNQRQLQQAYSSSRMLLRRFLLRPPMWTFEQYSPRQLSLHPPQPTTALPRNIPSIGIVTPSYNQARFLKATIDSVLEQAYPNLFYHVQDGGSIDGSVSILEAYDGRISWRSHSDKGQADAIDLGFNNADFDIMAYLNSDDVLLPGSLSYIANYFDRHPDIDIVYGHRVFIDSDGWEIGRAILPAHDKKALLYAGYIPQETMFWRRRVWEQIGGFDVSLQYALDWEFLLRAQKAGFKFARAPRFIACFRVHDQQKTTSNYDVGRREMRALRLKYLGHAPSQSEITRGISGYLARQMIFHWCYKLGLLKL